MASGTSHGPHSSRGGFPGGRPDSIDRLLNPLVELLPDAMIVAAERDLATVIELARRTVGEARRLVANLRPAVLDDLALAAAIRLQVDTLRTQGRSITYDDELGHERLPERIEAVLFRIEQESLTNVRRHAGGTRVHVAAARTVKLARVEVRDWSAGFDVNLPARGTVGGEQMGIIVMRERIALLGGRFALTRRPGSGTHIVAELPLS